MENKTYKIITFGCQMNENDSEKLSALLKGMGYTPIEDERAAGVVIINTCSVRENADVRVYGNLGTFKNVKTHENPDQILALCGCMMQQPEIVKKIKEKYTQVDIVFGTHNLHRFPELLSNFLAGGRERVFEVMKDGGIEEGLPVDRKYSFKSYVTIMNGCNNFCTYCIVPYTRGREISRRPEDILKEIRSLVEDGCLEVTLLGQNVNSYGRFLPDASGKPVLQEEGFYSFSDLLRDVDAIPGIQRIRFMTSHPKDLTDEVIQAMAQCEHVCPAIHLAIQSGSTKVLSEMHRCYTKEGIINLVQRIREQVPGVSITTDLIVGFPGETEDDFCDTLDVVRTCAFDSAFAFIYSIRPGTPAATYPDQVPDEIKHDRLNRLLDVLHECSAFRNKPYQDAVVEVLAEGVSKSNQTRLTGRTFSGKLVNFDGDHSAVGKLVKVKITEAKTFSLDGVQLRESEKEA